MLSEGERRECLSCFVPSDDKNETGELRGKGTTVMSPSERQEDKWVRFEAQVASQKTEGIVSWSRRSLLLMSPIRLIVAFQ